MPEAVDAVTTRAFWSGTITFGLVSVPVDLFAANRARPFSLKMLGPEGQPLKRRYVCSQDGKSLSGDDLVRGYELEEGRFVTVTDEELEALEPVKTRDIDLTRFVDRNEIDPSYFVRGYYLAPAGKSTKAYHLLASTMERTGRAGIATFVMRDKAYVVAIFAEGGLLRAETLRFHDELRTPDDVGLPAPRKADAKQVKRLEKLIGSMKVSKFPAADLHDEQVHKLRALAEDKHAKGKDVVRAPGAEDEEGGAEGQGGQLIDLMEVLKRRLGGAVEATSGRKGGSGKTAKAGKTNKTRKGKRIGPKKANAKAKASGAGAPRAHGKARAKRKA